jgi:hypothetical protein
MRFWFHRAFVLLLGSVVAFPAEAAPKRRPRRPRFEPTNLIFESPGELLLDVQVGGAIDALGGGERLYVPDFEAALGIFPHLQLGVTGAFAIDHAFEPALRALNGDALWTSVQWGLYDQRLGSYELAASLQFGPRIPLFQGLQGMGYGALALFSIARSGVHLALNAGNLVDPGTTFGVRPVSFVFGANLGFDLDAGKKFVWELQSGAAFYTREAYPDSVTSSSALRWNASKSVAFSGTLVVGLLGADRAAILFGVAPKIRLFE